jgi:hypothetical protein
MERLNKEFFLSFNAIIDSIDKYTNKVVKRTKVHNIIVNNGLNLVRNWMAGDFVDYPKTIALGTDATVVDATDIELGTEVLRSTATITKPTNYQVRYYKLFTVDSGESYAVKEVGIFDSIVVFGSTMFSHLNCDNTLDTDTDLAVTITYTLARV